MNRQPARQRFPSASLVPTRNRSPPDKEYLSTICWKRFHPVCLAHHCLNHRFDHGFDHWYSAGCRCANPPSRCAVLQLTARTTGSTGPPVGNSWRPAGIKHAFVFFTSGFCHCSDHWVDHWFNHRSAPVCRRAHTASPCALMRVFAQTTGSTGPLVGYCWHPCGNCCVFVFCVRC